MLEFLMSAPFLIGLAIGAVLGVFSGIGLGRRSARANAFYDQTRDKYDEASTKIRDRLDGDE